MSEVVVLEEHKYCYRCGRELSQVHFKDERCPFCNVHFDEELPTAFVNKTFTDFVPDWGEEIPQPDTVLLAWGPGFQFIYDDNGPPLFLQIDLCLIPKVTISEEDVADNRECTICMQEFELNETVRKLACQHVFHSFCLQKWFSVHTMRTCPYCRHKMNKSSNYAVVLASNIDNSSAVQEINADGSEITQRESNLNIDNDQSNTNNMDNSNAVDEINTDGSQIVQSESNLNIDNDQGNTENGSIMGNAPEDTNQDGTNDLTGNSPTD